MMETIHYPIKNRKIEEVVTQQTLDMIVTQMENWQQSAGVIGKLNLHPCWGNASVLDKRYQGESMPFTAMFSKIYRALYDKTGNVKWRIIANNLVAQMLYCQDKCGGFVHSTNEFEPTFDTAGCPIAFFHPIIALCEYYGWKHAEPNLKSQIPDAVYRHFAFMKQHIWRVGNAGRRNIEYPVWCGVTNQDLVATAALSCIGKYLGNWDIYEEYGKPVLDTFLSPAYYYKEIGLFERGDGHNFAERTGYNNIIMEMLKMIYHNTGDMRALEAADNVAFHMFDAFFVGEDGLTYTARGAKTDPKDKTKVLGWEYGSLTFEGYPATIMHLQEYLTRHPDEEKAQMVERLKETLAAYIYCDGNIPVGMFNPNPLYTIAGYPTPEGWVDYVMQLLGDNLQDPKIVELPCIHRIHKDFCWKQKERLWAIEKDGVRAYGGYTRYAAGVTIGPDEQPVWGSFDALENPDIVEILD